MNFNEVYLEYLKFAEKQQKKQGFNSLLNNFNSRILPYFKDMRLEDITRDDIVSWESYILSLGFRNNYNRNLYYMLSGFFTFCHNRYNFDKTIISDVGCFKKIYEKKKEDFYTLKEFNLFISNVDDYMYKTFFIFLFYTGVRPGEAMALKLSDFQGDYINIDKTIDSHGKREIGTPKTFSSIRKIKIDKFLKRDLKQLIKNYYKEGSGDLFLFGGLKPLSPTTINRHKFSACNRCGLRPITLHQFRHSHATLLLDKGIMINEISKRLGHSKVSTTLDINTHTNSTQEKRVYNILCSSRFNLNSLLNNLLKLNKF